MAFDTGKFSSLMTRTNGEIVPTMPDDEEFSANQIGAYVAGTPEMVGETHDGFFSSEQGRQGTRIARQRIGNIDVWRNGRRREILWAGYFLHIQDTWPSTGSVAGDNLALHGNPNRYRVVATHGELSHHS